MLYSLPNGKVVEISVEQYLELTDEELEYLISINFGEHIENPFFGSVLEGKMYAEREDEIILPELPEELLPGIDEDIDYEPSKD